ncbi:hypothetical protein C3E93_28165, partial [Klebsiella pneumoniae]
MGKMNWQRFNKVSSFSGETSGIVKKNFIITAALLSSLFLAAIVNLLGTVAKLAMRQPFVLFKGLTFQKLCLPGAFRPGD